MLFSLHGLWHSQINNLHLCDRSYCIEGIPEILQAQFVLMQNIPITLLVVLLHTPEWQHTTAGEATTSEQGHYLSKPTLLPNLLYGGNVSSVSHERALCTAFKQQTVSFLQDIYKGINGRWLTSWKADTKNVGISWVTSNAPVMLFRALCKIITFESLCWLQLNESTVIHLYQ